MSKKGIKLTEEHKRKISESHKGLKHCAESKKKISENNWLRNAPKEKHPMYGKKMSKEDKAKMSMYRTGMKHTEETKLKIKKLAKKRFEGHISKRKINDIVRKSTEYLQWRSGVFQRDNWTCQTCNLRGVALEAHHIRSFSELLSEFDIKIIDDAIACDGLWFIDNGVTLCKGCHRLTASYGNKKLKDEVSLRQ